MESLTYKLNKQQKHLKRTSLKFKPTLLLNKKEMQRVVMNLPKDTSALTSLIGPGKTAAYGDDILAITRVHHRDQDAFMECVLEMQAFVRGGESGMHVLDSVYRRILGHYKMIKEINEIFDVLDICTHQLTGRIKRKYYKMSDEDNDADMPSSQ